MDYPQCKINLFLSSGLITRQDSMDEAVRCAGIKWLCWHHADAPPMWWTSEGRGGLAGVCRAWKSSSAE